MEKENELKVNNLITLRNNYFLIVIALTGGCVSLIVNDITVIKIILFVLGLWLDGLFVLRIQVCSDVINKILRGK